jgi:hypothetical protein
MWHTVIGQEIWKLKLYFGPSQLPNLEILNADSIPIPSRPSSWRHSNSSTLWGNLWIKPSLLRLVNSCPKLKEIIVRLESINGRTTPGGERVEETAPKIFLPLPPIYPPILSPGFSGDRGALREWQCMKYG